MLIISVVRPLNIHSLCLFQEMTCEMQAHTSINHGHKSYNCQMISCRNLHLWEIPKELFLPSESASLTEI